MDGLTLEEQNEKLREQVERLQKVVRAAWYFRCHFGVPVHGGGAVSMYFVPELGADMKKLITELDGLTEGDLPPIF